MTKTVVLAALVSAVSFATPLEDACAALEKKPVAAAFPGAREVLCKGATVDCGSFDERKCDANIACMARRGSGSGPGCSPCTPDFVFWNCQSAPKDSIVTQVLDFDRCAARGGEWSKGKAVAFGQCVIPTATVRGKVVNAGVDVVLRVEGQDVPGVIQGGAYSLELDANVPTKLEVVDRKSGKSVTKTVTFKAREKAVVDFTFPK